MNSRQRFLETMLSGKPDRVPYFEEGVRPEVLRAWHEQGLPEGIGLSEFFPTDEREELQLDMDPHPSIHNWPCNWEDLRAFARRFDHHDRSRYPSDWRKHLPAWRTRDHVLMMQLHSGFFIAMGVNDWKRFHELILQLHNDPGLVKEMLRIEGALVAEMTETMLQGVELDAAIFSEPIGDNNGPLISPKMYKELVLSSYESVLQVLRRHGVRVIIVRTYANCRRLIPVLLEAGMDCLWACEVNMQAMDYRSLRAEFGPGLRLIGGIDLDVLRQDKSAIRREIEEKVPPLLAQGGYVPLADGRVRAEIPWENYRYYRELLEKVTRG